MDRILANQLKQLTPNPGIYQFFNKQGDLLYVGKAKNLRSRIRSYFQTGANLSPAKKIMVEKIHHLSTTIVKNETEALLFEGNLIKQYHPPYNIVLKDDKSWLYFAIDYREKYPRVTLERKPTVDGVKYFGPYPTASTVRNSFQILKKVLGLKTCTNPPTKPCFASKLGQCLGHRITTHSRSNYQQNLKTFESILRGHAQELIISLQKKMSESSQRQLFEKASKLRDQIKALQKITIKQNIISPQPESYDIWGVAHTNSNAATARLPVRRGILLDIEKFLLDCTPGLSEQEILNDFLEQYYPQAVERPKLVYLPTQFIEKKILGIKIIMPERGKKRSLIKMAQKAAAIHLDQSAASWERREVRAKNGLKELQKILSLPRLPQRIEGYDISNIQGQEAVGSMVVLTNGLADSKQYRKFKIQGLKTPNDVAMLAQIINRRFNKNKDWPLPDLVMLDGGAGQLTVAKKELIKFNTNLPLVALAKQEELLYIPNKSTPLKLPANSSALLLLQELRDEAHRFGITFYRSRHRKINIKSGWDELPGVGPVLKRKLKATFGSLNNLRQAPLDKVSAVVGQKRAQYVKKHLN
jgi:excinuclease ABC subunit C